MRSNNTHTEHEKWPNEVVHVGAWGVQGWLGRHTWRSDTHGRTDKRPVAPVRRAQFAGTAAQLQAHANRCMWLAMRMDGIEGS